MPWLVGQASTCQQFVLDVIDCFLDVVVPDICAQTFACLGCYVQRAIHLCLALVELSGDSVAVDRSHLALILKVARYRAVRLEVALKASIR